jgi:hypothetical protein
LRLRVSASSRSLFWPAGRRRWRPRTAA